MPHYRIHLSPRLTVRVVACNAQIASRKARTQLLDHLSGLPLEEMVVTSVTCEQTWPAGQEPAMPKQPVRGGLYPYQRQVIQQLQAMRYASMRELAQATRLSDGRVRRSLAALKKRGLVRFDREMLRVPKIGCPAGSSVIWCLEEGHDFDQALAAWEAESAQLSFCFPPPERTRPANTKAKTRLPERRPPQPTPEPVPDLVHDLVPEPPAKKAKPKPDLWVDEEHEAWLASVRAKKQERMALAGRV
jgi:hypothetical protein